MAERPLDLLTYGEAMVEFDEREPGYWLQGVGGDTLNVAVAARRAGAAVGFAGALGEDRWGNAIVAACHVESIEIGSVIRDLDHPTGLYFVTHDEAGHHFSYARKGSAASHHFPAHEFRAALLRSKCLHYSGISLAIASSESRISEELISFAEVADTKRSFDPNYRPRLWSPDEAQGPILAAMKSAHILLPGMDDMRNLFGLDTVEDALAFCVSLKPEVLVLKNGHHDIHVVDNTGHAVIAPPRVDAKDANGAGDCFDGVFLAAILAGRPSAHAAQEAAQAAADSTLRSGAQSKQYLPG